MSSSTQALIENAQYLEHPIAVYLLTNKKVIPKLDWANKNNTEIWVNLRIGYRFTNFKGEDALHYLRFPADLQKISTAVDSHTGYCFCADCRRNIVERVMLEDYPTLLNIKEWMACLKKSQS